MSYEVRDLGRPRMRRPRRVARTMAPAPHEPPPADPMPPAEGMAPDPTAPPEPSEPYPTEATGPESAEPSSLGWTVAYLNKTPPGHETLTYRAMGTSEQLQPSPEVTFTVGGVARRRMLSPGEVKEIVEGNRRVDLGWMGSGVGVLFSLNKAEQRRHALRADYNQSQPAALADIVSELRRLFTDILVVPKMRERFARIGQALHLIQDSYSPAHTCRKPQSNWCITYIRNYGRGGRSGNVEHRVPTDPRDHVSKQTTEAARAADASREYLQIAFKAMYGREPHPDAAVAAAEAARDFQAFVPRHFASCFEPEGWRHCP